MANTYSNVGGTGSGEANTASSVGQDPDKEIVAGKVGVDLKFKRLSAGANITLDDTTDPNAIKISTPGGAANAFSTIATDNGSSPVAQSETDTLTLKSTDGSVIITGDETNDSVNFQVVSAPQAAGYSSILTEFGTATAAGPAETVNFTSSDGSVTIIAGDGSGFPDIVDFSASGGLGIVIDNGETLDFQYDGDVILAANAKLPSGTVTIKGDLYMPISGATLTSLGAPATLRVSGKIVGPSTGLPATIEVSSFFTNSGTLTCNGDVINTNINAQNTRSGGANGGDVTILGSFIGPDCEINTSSTGSVESGSTTFTAGNITVEGDCTVRKLTCNGITTTIASTANGGNGGSITIGGDLVVTQNGIYAQGGSALGAGGTSGQGGSLTVGGNFTCLGATSIVRLQAGIASNGNGGYGGTIQVNGDTYVENQILLDGGAGQTGGASAPNPNDVVFYGKVKASIINMNGGTGNNANGGNAASTPKFLGGIAVDILTINGGNAQPTFNNGSSFTTLRIEGGGHIGTLTMLEGTGGNETAVASDLQLANGSYVLKEIQSTSKAGPNFQLLRGEDSTLAVTSLTGVTTLQGLNDVQLATTPTELTESIYKFGDATTDVKKIGGAAGATVLSDLTDVDTTGVTPGNILEYSGTQWVPTAAPAAADPTFFEVAAGFTMESQYKGTVRITGNCFAPADVVIYGDLIFTGGSIDGQANGTNLTVHGNVYGNGSWILSNHSSSPGNITIKGNSHKFSIYNYNTNTASFGNYNGGSVTVDGDFIEGSIFNYGANSNQTFVSAGSAGSIFIRGDATVNTVDAKGGNCLTDSDGGFGSNFTCGGTLCIKNSSEFKLNGGNANTGNAGSSGSLTVVKDLIIDNPFGASFSLLLDGGTSNGGNGGNGGNIKVGGATSVNSASPTFYSRGGYGFATCGNSCSDSVFTGPVTGDIDLTFRFTGGDSPGLGVNGGNGGNVTFLNGVNAQLIDCGGGIVTDPNDTNGSSGDVIISGGANINFQIDITDGSTGTLGLQPANSGSLLLQHGTYYITDVNRSVRGSNHTVVELDRCTASFVTLSNVATLYKAGGALSVSAGSPAEIRQSTYKSSGSNIYRSATPTTLT